METDATVIIDDAPARVRTVGDPDRLWLSADDARRVAGWEVTPDGACRDVRCVPLPPGAVADDGRVDLVALARRLGQPVVHDVERRVWVIGEAADDLRDRLTSLDAPDFRLPDLGNRMHSLSDYRGKKVFLVAWASW